jgi:hypothetical protein
MDKSKPGHFCPSFTAQFLVSSQLKAFGFRRQEAHMYSVFGRRKEKNINAKIFIFPLLDK